MTDKKHKNYPSRYKIDEIVQLNFGKGRVIKDVVIDGIYFSSRKIYYDVSFEYDEGVWVNLDNIDSIFVEDKDQETPNRFAKFEDVKLSIEEHITKTENKKPKKSKKIDPETIERLNRLYRNDK